MDTHSYVFGNDDATPGAFLRRAAWVNECNTPTSVCSFVGSELHELTPSNIRNAAANCLVPVGLHILDVEFFKGNELVFIHQLARFLMGKVIAPIGGSFVGMTQCLNDLTALSAALGELLFLTLQAGNVSGVFLHPALAVNLFAIAEIGKGRQAKVNTDNVVISRQRLNVALTREASVEVANRVTLDSQGFDVGADGAMQINGYVANLGDPKPVTDQLKARLGKGEAIVQALALKAWVSRFFASLDTAKESLKSQIDTLLHVLQNLGVNFS